MLNDKQRSEWEKKDRMKERAYQDKMERREIARGKAGARKKEFGVTSEGFNFTLGKYIEGSSHYRQEWKKYKQTHPDSEMTA